MINKKTMLFGLLAVFVILTMSVYAKEQKQVPGSSASNDFVTIQKISEDKDGDQVEENDDKCEKEDNKGDKGDKQCVKEDDGDDDDIPPVPVPEVSTGMLTISGMLMLVAWKTKHK